MNSEVREAFRLAAASAPGHTGAEDADDEDLIVGAQDQESLEAQVIREVSPNATEEFNARPFEGSSRLGTLRPRPGCGDRSKKSTRAA